MTSEGPLIVKCEDDGSQLIQGLQSPEIEVASMEIV